MYMNKYILRYLSIIKPYGVHIPFEVWIVLYIHILKSMYVHVWICVCVCAEFTTTCSTYMYCMYICIISHFARNIICIVTYFIKIPSISIHFLRFQFSIFHSPFFPFTGPADADAKDLPT